MLELAGQFGYDGLPAADVDELATLFRTAAHSGSLVRYLEPFAHTVGVMQTPEALHRVAFECVEDLAADNVVYAEIRFAPELHIDGGLSLDAVVDAVLAGFADGEKAAGAEGRGDHGALSGHRDAARRAVARDRRAGDPVPRQGRRGLRHRGRRGRATRPPGTWTPSSTCEATTRASPFTPARRSGCRPSTRRSRSAAPTGSGHGVRIVDDIAVARRRRRVRLGRLASILRDKRIPLELCPSSNVQTGAVDSIAEHPFDLLARLRFRVTVNTDNRLMSDTTMSQEMLRLVEAFGYGWSDLERFTINAMKSAFIPFDERLALIDDVIKPRYAVLVG